MLLEGCNVTNNEKTLLFEDKTLKQSFTSVPKSVLKCPHLSPGAKVTYCLLLTYAWQDNETFPGQERLARDLGYKSTRSVRIHLNELREARLISWKRRGLTLTNVYIIKSLAEFLEWQESRQANALDSDNSNQEDIDFLDRKNFSGQESNPDWKDFSSPERKNYSGQERKNTSDKIYPEEKDPITNLFNNNVSGSSLRSDPETSAALRASGGGNIFTGEKQNEPSPPDSSQEEKNTLPSSNFTITEKLRSSPEEAFTAKVSKKTGELQRSSGKNKKETPEVGREQKGDDPHPPYPPPPSSPKVTENSDNNGLTNKDIISALGDAFLVVPGMAERYDGPQKKRVYALMGRLYNRLDCEPVYQAIDALKKKAGAVDDPLRFVAGVAERFARKSEERKMGEEEYYAALRRKVDRALERVGGNADLLTAEERRWVRDLNAYDWYQAVKANGEKWRREHPDYRERMKQYYEERRRASEELRRREEEKRQKEREQLLMLIYQPEPSDPALKQIADAQREIARKELERLDSLDIFLPDGKKVRHIATIAESFLKGASA